MSKYTYSLMQFHKFSTILIAINLNSKIILLNVHNQST